MIENVIAQMNSKIDSLKKSINEDIADIKEAKHENLLMRNDAKQALIDEGFLESQEEEEWVCEVCGHVHRGKKPPKECPLCRVEKEYFKKKSKDVTRG